MINIRATATKSIHNVIFLKSSLHEQSLDIHGSDRALWQELVYGTLRLHLRLKAYADTFIKKTPKGRNAIILTLIEVGLYQLLYTNIPPYAAINETVNAASELKCSDLKGLVNAVLRKALANKDKISDQIKKESEIYAHPQWLIKRLKKDYPKSYKNILEANNNKPPIWLRVNIAKITLKKFESMLKDSNINVAEVIPPSAIKLKDSTQIISIPGYEEGLFYVQDLSAQRAVLYLDPKPKERILDACAAPGGKTTHILELCKGDVDLTALDIKPQRLEKLKENLKRQNWQIKVATGSASEPNSWWDGKLFDKILIDAPCSGTGVIRRHPEIKHVRTEEEIHILAKQQSEMLESLWPLLKKGGCMMYTTCSVLKEENATVINNFVYKYKNEVIWEELPVKQQLTGENDQDGFFYARLVKKEAIE